MGIYLIVLGVLGLLLNFVTRVVRRQDFEKSTLSRLPPSGPRSPLCRCTRFALQHWNQVNAIRLELYKEHIKVLRACCRYVRFLRTLVKTLPTNKTGIRLVEGNCQPTPSCVPHSCVCRCGEHDPTSGSSAGERRSLLDCCWRLHRSDAMWDNTGEMRSATELKFQDFRPPGTSSRSVHIWGPILTESLVRVIQSGRKIT